MNVLEKRLSRYAYITMTHILVLISIYRYLSLSMDNKIPFFPRCHHAEFCPSINTNNFTNGLVNFFRENTAKVNSTSELYRLSGGEISFICNPSYKIPGLNDNLLVLKCGNGSKWSSDPPTCGKALEAAGC